MQLHQLKAPKRKRSRRVGRGGKRGTYSGRGNKGQKARAGASQRPDFRGGDQPLWKLLPKLRGSTKKQELKKRSFQVRYTKPAIVNLVTIENTFADGAVVSKRSLVKADIIKTGKHGVKILGTGELTKKVTFEGVTMSKSALEKANKVGAEIVDGE